MKHFKLKDIKAPTRLAICYLIVLMVPNVLLDFTESYSLIAKAVNIILPCGIYLMLLSSLRRVGLTTLLMLPFSILAAFQIVLLYLYGEAIIAVDMYLNVFTTNPAEATELLANLGPAIIAVIILYLPPIVWGIVLLCKHRKLADMTRRRMFRGGVATFIAGLALLGIAYATDTKYRVERQTFPINVIYNIKVAVDEGNRIHNYHKTSAYFSYGAVATHPADSTEIYIVIVGETSRGDNWQLGGYDRPTNPRLSEREGVTFFKHAISESNTTHKSVPLLLTSLRAENYDSVNCYKSIITAFNEAGYRTSFISNQAPNRSYTEFFSYEADSTVYLPAGTFGRDVDGKMIPYVEKCLEDTAAGRQFIVLHGYGSHFKYAERYPEEYRVFTPDECKSASFGNRHKLINAYDNSIVYTDAWLDELFGKIEATGRPAAVIYVSDHGEDIMDDYRKRFLHASPTPTFEQLHVAMLAWLSPEYRKRYPEKAALIESRGDARVNSSVATFNTMIDLAGLSTPRFDSKESIASETYSPAPQRFLNDQNEAIPLEESGFKAIDIEKVSPHLNAGR